MKQQLILLSILSFSFSVFGQNSEIPDDIYTLMNRYTCLKCHKIHEKSIGPSFADIADKKNKTDRLIELMFKPEPSNWPGFPPMAPIPQLTKEDAKKIAKWIRKVK